MRKLSGIILLLIILSAISNSQGSQNLEIYIFSRINHVDTEFRHTIYEGSNPPVTRMEFGIEAEIWNSADEPLTISFSHTIAYYLRMINLTSNEDTHLDSRGFSPMGTDIEFKPGTSKHSLIGVLILEDLSRIPTGNYEIYFGDRLRNLNNSFSAYLEISENSTIVTYDDPPSDWGETYDITDYAEFIPYIAFISMIVLAVLLYWKCREY